MKSFLAQTLLSTVVVTATLLISSTSTPAEETNGWTELLPGNNLDKYWTTKGNWQVNDQGVVQLTPRDGEKGWSRFDAYLWLKDKQYKNFEFQFDYQVEKSGNSGFYFHVAEMNNPVARGIEVQIYDSGSKPDGARLTDHDSGGVIPGIPPSKNAAKPAGEWNTFHITVNDKQLTVKLNGTVVNEVNLAENAKLKTRPETGFIGFQDHGLPLKLRNMKVKEL